MRIPEDADATGKNQLRQEFRENGRERWEEPWEEGCIYQVSLESLSHVLLFKEMSSIHQEIEDGDLQEWPETAEVGALKESG